MINNEQEETVRWSYRFVLDQKEKEKEPFSIIWTFIEIKLKSDMLYINFLLCFYLLMILAKSKVRSCYTFNRKKGPKSSIIHYFSIE